MDPDSEADDFLLEPGRNCWRVERAERAALIVDAADYFALARQTMLQARHQLLLIGWDFDTRIPLVRDAEDDAPAKLGPFLTWLANNRPGLSIHILKWDLGAIKLLGRGSTIFRLARWAWSERISFKLDSAHAFGASHHHKIVVVDDVIAFCGGIDMTASRWDTREHLDRDRRRRRPTTGRGYGPWHDATMAVSGPAARALGELARERWAAAGGARIGPPPPASELWPEELQPALRESEVAIARTRGGYGQVSELREIEALFVDMIAAARRFVYAESQYFASRAIAAAICERLAEPDGPEFVLVNPKSCDGWIEEAAMSSARARLMRVLRSADRHRRFRIYTPATTAGDDIYVHSKMMIVDDELLRVGSANMNNRSMGLDSECDLMVDGRRQEGARASIAAIRNDLLAEHLGVERGRVETAFASAGSLIAAIESLRGGGRTLLPLDPEEPGTLGAAIADSEALDPEGAGAGFEPLTRPGLFAGLRAAIRRGQARGKG